MATATERQQFVEQLMPIVQKYAKEYGYNESVCPAIVAQACMESGYGTSNLAITANNFFGMKHGGKNVYSGKTYSTMDGKIYTTDQIIITTENRSSYWRAYDSMEEGVKGYFDLLDQKNSNGNYYYGDLRQITDPAEYLKQIASKGYAGSGNTTYANNCISIMENMNLIELNDQTLNYTDEFENISDEETTDEEIPSEENQEEEQIEEEVQNDIEDNQQTTPEEIPQEEQSTEISTEEVKEENTENYESNQVENSQIITPTPSYIQSTPNHNNQIISSDLDLVIENANHIKNNLQKAENKINNVNVYNTVIISNLSSCQNILFSISSELSSLLSKDLDVFVSIAKNIDNLDKSLANEIVGINDSLSSINYQTDATELYQQKISSFLVHVDTAESTDKHIVDKSELQSMISGTELTGTIHENLESERQNAQIIQESIESFKNQISSKLEGEIWNKVSIKLDAYSDLMYKKIKAANILENAIKKAITTIINCMGDEDALNYSENIINELNNQINRIKSQINNINTQIASLDDTKQTEYIDLKNKITQLNTQLNEIENNLEKIKNLKNAINEAENIINEAIETVYNEYGSAVNNIVPGKELSYS